MLSRSPRGFRLRPGLRSPEGIPPELHPGPKHVTLAGAIYVGIVWEFQTGTPCAVSGGFLSLNTPLSPPRKDRPESE